MVTDYDKFEKLPIHSLANILIHVCTNFHQNRTMLNGRSAPTDKHTDKPAGDDGPRLRLLEVALLKKTVKLQKFPVNRLTHLGV